MTDEKNKAAEKEKQKKQERENTLKLLITVLLAFLASLLFRQSMGIWSMTPLAFLLIAAGAFIGIRPLIKNTVYCLCVFAVNTVEQKDIVVSFIFVALCLLVRIVSDLAVWSYNKSKKRCIVIALAGALVTTALSFAFVGNPFTAAMAKKDIDAYLTENYPTEESDLFGEFEFSSIHFNFRTRAYETDAVSSKFPTEGASISVMNGHVTDRFEGYMEEKLAEPYVLEITEVLRNSFPTESFGVSYESIATLPGDQLLAKGKGELYGCISFRINISGIQTATAMKSAVKKYLTVIEEAGIKYHRIEFVSGTNPWVKRSVTIYNDRLGNDFDSSISYIPAFSFGAFNRHLQQMAK